VVAVAAVVLRGDARNLPFPDESVDLIVTSPPYFGLRSYQDGGEHYGGQIGAEQTPAEYVAALLDCTREWVRVLKPEGSLWVNLGDKYATADHPNNLGGASSLNAADDTRAQRDQANRRVERKQYGGVRQKSLTGLPWRYALGCVDDLGLILRAEVIWSKPNGLPESVKDRVRRSHETWFHLVKSPRYFAAVDEIREVTDRKGKTWEQRKASGVTWTPGIGTRGTHLATGATPNSGMAPNPLGKLPGSVWQIATQPLRVPPELAVDHFAAFPMEWPRRIVSGWSPSGICTACGEGRRPVSERVTGLQLDGRKRPAADSAESWSETTCTDNQWGGKRTFDRGVGALITGYACACPDTSAPTRPAVVLDPFGGTGTVALVADVLGRHGVSVDMSADYCRVAEWRTADPKQRERALNGPKARRKPVAPAAS
jgi:DNA modification methylase